MSGNSFRIVAGSRAGLSRNEAWVHSTFGSCNYERLQQRKVDTMPENHAFSKRIECMAEIVCYNRGQMSPTTLVAVKSV